MLMLDLIGEDLERIYTNRYGYEDLGLYTECLLLNVFYREKSSFESYQRHYGV